MHGIVPSPAPNRHIVAVTLPAPTAARPLPMSVDAASDYPPSWYAASQPLPPARPALQGPTRADVAVLGAGYTGLTAALALAEKGYRVTVLEAERVGWGEIGRAHV